MAFQFKSLLAGGVLAFAAAAAVADVQSLPSEPAVAEAKPFLLAAPPPTADESWHHKSYFTFWLFGINGDIGIRDRKAEIDASWDDVSENMSFGLNPNHEFRKGDFIIMVEAMWARWDRDVDLPALGVSGNITTDFVLVSPTLGWRFLDMPLGGAGSNSSLKVDGLVGLRWTYMNVEVERDNGDDRSADDNWFDPYVGARVIWNLSKEWEINGKATIGGFGVGSDLIWSAEAMLEYHTPWKIFGSNIAAAIGYRALAYDYEEDNFLFDVTMHGPLIGLTFTR